MRNVIPAGNWPTALAGLAWLVASSPNFQAWVGASGPTAAQQALAHVVFESDDSEESGSTRPRAIVYTDQFEETKVALTTFRPTITLWLSFEAPPAAAIEAETPREDRLWDERLDFLNHVQAVLDDMKALNGCGTGYVAGESNVAIGPVRKLAGPDAVEEVRAAGELGEIATYFWGVVFEVEIHG